jgi:uncharacterized protein YcgL (UPF0745 family)
MIAMMLFGQARTTEVRQQIREIQQAWYRQLDLAPEDDHQLVQHLSQTADTTLRQSRFCEGFLYLRRQFRQCQL